ncbi:MAG: succinylglutamate desuccinylase/aspartoacylase family protein, partial [Gemmatimonadota bacterium]|nr:succinylglutamate desuccinylase/aspartoacylase family protein [Gemmatimonadota bacterium]
MGRALRIGGVTVRRGQIRRIEIPIARLPAGTFLSLPVRVIHGRSAGPRLWIDAALHGDEINGVEIIRELLHRLDPAALR